MMEFGSAAQRLRHLVQDSEKTVIFTGAGMSTESGILVLLVCILSKLRCNPARPGS